MMLVTVLPPLYASVTASTTPVVRVSDSRKPLVSVMRIYETEGLYWCFWIQVPVGIFVAH